MSTIQIRPFQNTDVPGIVRVWNQAEQFAGLRRPIDTLLFDAVVLSKPYFRREDFIVAVDRELDAPFSHDGRVVGFIHGGYAPNTRWNDVDYTKGYIAMFLGEPREDQTEIAMQLLQEMERVFLRQGTRDLYAGAVYPNAPFYLGLLSGGELYGFLESDPLVPYVLQKNRFYSQSRCHLFRIALADYRVRMTRFIIQMQRQYQIVENLNPRPENWWEAWALSTFQWRRFELIHRETHEVCAAVIVRRLENSLQQQWGMRIGLHNLNVKPEYRHQGLARFFVGKVLQILSREGFAYAELQISENNVAAISAFENLNFERFATGVVYHKESEMPEKE